MEHLLIRNILGKSYQRFCMLIINVHSSALIRK
nr:MAG TPA: hypothetical protein [Caudoviricetes sp.]